MGACSAHPGVLLLQLSPPLGLPSSSGVEGKSEVHLHRAQPLPLRGCWSAASRTEVSPAAPGSSFPKAFSLRE